MYNRLRKHFRCTSNQELPTKNAVGYHPLQNVMWASQYLRDKAQHLWIPGEIMSLDEDRVKSRSKRNVYKSRQTDKPTREGWTVPKLGDRGENGGTFVYNDIVKCGKFAYTDTSKGKIYNLVEQLLQCPGMIRFVRIIVTDSAYVTTILLKDDALLWYLCFIGTATAKTAHLPETFSAVKSVAPPCNRGYSQTMYCYPLNITFWNYLNSVTFLDNDFVSGPEQWNFIETRACESLLEINAPLVTLIYRRLTE